MRPSLTFLMLLVPAAPAVAQDDAAAPRVTIRAKVQSRPGGPREDFDVPVHAVPDGLPAVPATEVDLPPGDLVLGVVVDDEALAFPVRFLGLHEVTNHRLGRVPLAATW